MSKLTELADKLEEVREEIKKKGESAIKEAFKEYFAANPIAHKVIWTQFTPYFADGDPCIFSMNDFEVRLDPSTIPESYHDEENDEQDDDEYAYGETYYDLKKTKEQKAAIDNLKKLYKECLPLEEVFKNVFGDHVKVIATPKGFKVIDYDHD